MRSTTIARRAAAWSVGALLVVSCNSGNDNIVSNTVAIPSSGLDVRVAPTTLDTGQVVPVSYSVIDPNGTVLTGVPAAFAITDTSIASVSADGQVRGIAYGQTMLAVTVDTVTRMASVSVTPWPHEPPGFTKVTERDFSKLATSPSDTVGLDGWDAHEESMWPHLSIVSDPLAPRSPPFVLQALYPAGTQGGSSDATPGRLQRQIPGSPQTIYFSVWVQLSANWQANPTGTNKILYVWIGNQPRFFLSAEGSNAAALAPTGRLQGTPDDEIRHREALPPNVNTQVRVVPGMWQRWEVVITANTPGVANGAFHLWIDGVEVGNYTDVEYLAANENFTWNLMDIEPIWGGGGGVLTEAQNMRFDHIYISRQ